MIYYISLLTGFQTDDSIGSKTQTGSMKEMKELEPWAGDDLNEELSTLGGDDAVSNFTAWFRSTG